MKLNILKLISSTYLSIDIDNGSRMYDSYDMIQVRKEEMEILLVKRNCRLSNYTEKKGGNRGF